MGFDFLLEAGVVHRREKLVLEKPTHQGEMFRKLQSMYALGGFLGFSRWRWQGLVTCLEGAFCRRVQQKPAGVDAYKWNRVTPRKSNCGILTGSKVDIHVLHDNLEEKCIIHQITCIVSTKCMVFGEFSISGFLFMAKLMTDGPMNVNLSYRSNQNRLSMACVANENCKISKLK